MKQPGAGTRIRWEDDRREAYHEANWRERPDMQRCESILAIP